MLKGSCQRLGLTKRSKVSSSRFVIGKWEVLGVRLQKEVERIEDRHLRYQIHFHQEFGGRFSENQTSEIVGLRVLLPVQEVVLGMNFERIGQDRCAAMGCWPQPDNLGSKLYETVVPILSFMIQCNLNRHRSGYFPCGWLTNGSRRGELRIRFRVP